MEDLEQNICCISDARLCEFRLLSQETFINYIRSRYSRQMAMIGMPLPEKEIDGLFDPNFLTVGFARRFVSYKRPNLLLRNPERLRRILLNSERPVQLLLAGKAHPGDAEGKNLIKEWVVFINNFELKDRIVFLSDYDMLLTEHLVQGVDLWINTPQRPWEACGTSGMKVLVNGGLNLSELDGWWDEAYQSEVGWAFGDRKEHRSDPAWDGIEVEQLYDLLEQKIIPEFYTVNSEGISEAWMNRMRASMARLTPRFSANRSLREYIEKYYLSAARNYLHFAANKGKRGKQINDWKCRISEKWKELRFVHIAVETKEEKPCFFVQVYMNGLRTGEIDVELYADGINDGEPVRKKMELLHTGLIEADVVTYTASVPADRPIIHYTSRVIPHNSLISIPLECALILWGH